MHVKSWNMHYPQDYQQKQQKIFENKHWFYYLSNSMKVHSWLQIMTLELLTLANYFTQKTIWGRAMHWFSSLRLGIENKEWTMFFHDPMTSAKPIWHSTVGLCLNSAFSLSSPQVKIDYLLLSFLIPFADVWLCKEQLILSIKVSHDQLVISTPYMWLR